MPQAMFTFEKPPLRKISLGPGYTGKKLPGGQDLKSSFRRCSLKDSTSTNPNNNVFSKPSSIDLGTKKKIYTSEEVEAIKASYERKIEDTENTHQDNLDQVRSDMAFVVSSLKQGSSSDTIIDLQARIKELEQAVDDARAETKEEVNKLQVTLKKSESKNFFSSRRNEEMGAKIYQMQNEIEELDRKHCLEVQIYQERLAALGGGTDIDSKTTDVLRQNAQLEDRVSALQLQLNTIRNERECDIDVLAMQLRDEKQKAIVEMTDKVLKLESIIDDMKESHAKEIKAYEKSQRDQKRETDTKDRKQIEELETTIDKNEKEYERKFEEISKEHKKVVDELRLFYEKEIGDIKKRTSSDVTDGSVGQISTSRRTSVDQALHVKQMSKELKEKHEKEVENLKMNFSKERDLLRQQQEREISDIRIQYDEKLKMGYKEGLRRQSVSERRTEATKMKELTTQKEAAELKCIALESKYADEVKGLHSRNHKLQSLVGDLKKRLSGDVTDSVAKRVSLDTLDEGAGGDSLEDEESQRKLKEIQEQIERYERRIEYYQEKSQREKTEESHRVSELQSEIVELHKEVNNIKESRRKQVYEKEKREKVPGERHGYRRNTDGSMAARRHTDTETALKAARPRDPRKRWSNLEERSEVIARNIATLDGKRNPRLSVTVKV